MSVPVALLLLLGLAAFAFAQETKAPEGKTGGQTESSDEGEGGLQIWNWANFVILASGLGYLIAKNAGPMFAARSSRIRKEMIEAGDARQEAEERAAAVDRRLAGLEQEIVALREESRLEAQAESNRQAQATAGEIQKIRQHAEQEIAAAGRAARQELKRYAAQLAVGLAEQRIRARMTPATQDSLVQGFVRHLK